MTPNKLEALESDNSLTFVCYNCQAHVACRAPLDRSSRREVFVACPYCKARTIVIWPLQRPPSPADQHVPLQKDLIKKLYSQGLPNEEICRRANCTMYGLYKVIKKPAKLPRIPQAMRRKVLQLFYGKGYTPYKISRLLGISRSTAINIINSKKGAFQWQSLSEKEKTEV